MSKTTKIKNFRVSLRPREIARVLKNRFDITVTPEQQITINEIAEKASEWIEPSSVFETYKRETALQTLKLPIPPKAVAVSVLAVTLQVQSEESTEKALIEAGSFATQLRQAIIEEALKQAVHFCLKIVHDQAKEEDCDASPAIDVPQAASQHALAQLLEADRIGLIGEDVASSSNPFRIAWLFWMPSSRSTAKQMIAALEAIRDSIAVPS